MGRDVTSVLNDAHLLSTAFDLMDDISLLCAGHESFRARVTDVTLKSLRLLTIEENLARIALVKVPQDIVLVSYLAGRHLTQVWGGMAMGAPELIAVGPGSELFVRTAGACRWCVICAPASLLSRLRRAVIGLPAPPLEAISFWRPSGPSINQLRRHHTAAIRAAHTNWELLTRTEAIHGLEQELIYSIIECMAEGRAAKPAGSCRRQQDLVKRLHRYLLSCREGTPKLVECCAVLGVSRYTLHRACEKQFGMGPVDYLRLWNSRLETRPSSLP